MHQKKINLELGGKGGKRKNWRNKKPKIFGIFDKILEEIFLTSQIDENSSKSEKRILKNKKSFFCSSIRRMLNPEIDKKEGEKK